MDHLRSVAMVLSFVDVGLGAEMGARFLLRALRLGEPNFIALGLALLAGHSGVEAPSCAPDEILLQAHGPSRQGLGQPQRSKAPLRPGTGCIEHFGGAWRTSIQHLDRAEANSW